MRVSRRRWVVRFLGLSQHLRRRLAAALGAAAIAVAAARASAQETPGTVTGKVTAVDGNTPLAGVTVFVTGAQTGAITRNDGTYRISLRPGKYELRVRYIG